MKRFTKKFNLFIYIKISNKHAGIFRDPACLSSPETPVRAKMADCHRKRECLELQWNRNRAENRPVERISEANLTPYQGD